MCAPKSVEDAGRVSPDDGDDCTQLALVARLTTNAVIITNVARRITWVNAGFERVTGYSAAEALGRSPGELLQCGETDPQVIERMRAALNAGEGFKGQLINRHRDGRLYWLDIEIQPVRLPDGTLDGFVAVETDITEHKALLANLERRNAKLAILANVVQRTSNAVLTTDRDANITWVNEAFTRLYGYTLEQALGHNPGDLLASPNSPPASRLALRRAVEAGRSCRVEVVNLRADGTEMCIDTDLQPTFDDQGDVNGFIGVTSDITQARNAALELAEKSQWLARIIHSTQVGTWDHDLLTQRVAINDLYASMLGYTAAECVEHMQPSFMALVHPQDQGALARAREAYLGGDKDQYEVEFRMRHREGNWVWILSRGMVTHRDADGQPVMMAGIHLDITARKQAEAERERSAQLLRGAIDTFGEAFALYDPDDRLVYCNQQYQDYYADWADLIVPGANFEHIITEGARRGLYPEALGRLEAWVAERMTLHRSGDLNLIQKLGNGRTLRLIERKMPDGHTVAFRIDISSLVRATEAAEAASRAKSDFIATISHELRTPLQSIFGFSELGEMHAAAQGLAKFEGMFKRIHDGSQRMLSLVNGLLDLSKLDRTFGSMKLYERDMAVVIRDVVDEVRDLAGKRQLQFTLPDTDQTLPVSVDDFRIRQVIRNVLANAIRFAPEGSLIDIDWHREPQGGLDITVSDSGPGIPPDELEVIFEPFVQSSRTRDGSGGTGLGLSICRKIMSAHGGNIEAGNGPAGGAVMHIRLPAAAHRSASEPAGASSPGRSPLPH